MDDELLRALARRGASSPGENDPGMHTSSEASYDERVGDDALSRPFTAEEREAVLDAVFARLDADGSTEAAEVVPAPVELAPRRAARARWGALLGAAVAIAAALVLWLGRPGAEALPEYTVTSQRGGDSAVRAEPQTVDRVLMLDGPDAAIDVVVSPARAVAGPLAVTLIASGVGAPRKVALEGAEISPSGAVRLRGPLSRFVALERGTWALTIVVSPADRVPSDAETALADDGLGRAVVHVEIR